MLLKINLSDGIQQVINDIGVEHIKEPANKFDPYSFLINNQDFIEQKLEKNLQKSMPDVQGSNDYSIEEIDKIEEIYRLTPNYVLPWKYINISPIALNVELNNNLSDNYENPIHDFNEAVSIIMKDGTKIEPTSSGSGSNPLTSYVYLMFKQPINIEQIDKIVIGDIEINYE